MVSESCNRQRPRGLLVSSFCLNHINEQKGNRLLHISTFSLVTVVLAMIRNFRFFVWADYHLQSASGLDKSRFIARSL